MLPLAISNGEVIIGVVLLVAPIAAIAFAGSGAVYREIGKGAFAMDHDRSASGSDLGPAMSRAAREVEVRQLLEAKAFRQRARGETPIDVDAELARVTGPAPAAPGLTRCFSPRCASSSSPATNAAPGGARSRSMSRPRSPASSPTSSRWGTRLDAGSAIDLEATAPVPRQARSRPAARV